MKANGITAIVLVAVITLLLAVQRTVAYNVAVLCSSTTSTCTAGGSTNPFIASYFQSLEEAKRPGELVSWVAVPYEGFTDGDVANVSLSLRASGTGHIVVSAPGMSIVAAVVEHHRAALGAELLVTMVDPPDELAAALSNNTQVIFLRDDEVGFLAGIVAGTHTTTGEVAICAGRSVLALRNIRGGFQQGVLQVCPSCVIHGAYMSTFSDAALAISCTSEMVQRGADVLFAPAGSAGNAAIRNVSAGNAAFVIGIDVDEFFTTFEGQHSSPGAARLLSSALKRTSVGVRISVADGRHGSFTPGTRLFGIAEGAVSLAPCHASCDSITPKSKALIENAVLRARLQEAVTHVDAMTGIVLQQRLVFPEKQFQPLRPGPRPSLALGLKRVVFVDGNWARASFFDYGSMILESGRTGQSAAVPELPQLSGGIATAFVSAPIPFTLVHGGVQDEALGSRAFAMLWTDCPTSADCTTSPRWLAVTQHPEGAIPAPRQHHAVAAAGNVVVLAGGVDGAGHALGDVWLGRISSNSLDQTPIALSIVWEQLPSLEEARHSHSVIVWWPPSAPNASTRRSAAGAGEEAGDMRVVVAGGHTRGPLVAVLDIQEGVWSGVGARGHGHGRRTDSSLSSGGDGTHREHYTPCLVTDTHSWTLAVISANGTTRVNLATGTTHHTPTLSPPPPPSAESTPGVAAVAGGEAVADQPWREGTWPAQLRGAVACAVAAEQEPTMVRQAGSLGRSGASGSHGSRRHALFFLPQTAADTNELRVMSVAAVRCDASLGLFRTPDGASCMRCPREVEFDECPPAPPPSSRTTTGNLMLLVVIPGVFLLGAVVGGLAWFFLLDGAVGGLARAPTKGTMGIAFISLVETSALWRASPQQMGAAVHAFHRAVGAAVRTYGGCEVRRVADAHLLVAHSPAELIRVARAVLLAAADAVGCDGRQLTCRAAVHFAAPTVLQGDGAVHQYVGPEVDNLVACAKAFRGSRLLITADALEQVSPEDLELPPLEAKTVIIKSALHGVPARIKVFHAQLTGSGDPTGSGDGFRALTPVAPLAAPSHSGCGSCDATTRHHGVPRPADFPDDGGGSRSDSLLDDAHLAEHPHVVMGISSIRECRRITRVLMSILDAAMAPLSTAEQLAFRRCCMTHLRTADDSLARLALAVTQQMDLVELRQLLEQFYTCATLP